MEKFAGIGKKKLELIHNAGVRKSTSHVFVYRYPDSDNMPAMDADKFTFDAKKESKKDRELAFYLHIPFCTSVCSYCHYYKQLPPEEKQIEQYLKSLEKEISTYKKFIDAKIEANSVLFGGGTPTVLKAGQLNSLMEFLQAAFPMPKKIEATIESSPETLDLEKLAELRQYFNRLSIGVQDFDDGVLKACNRNHNKEQALKAVKDAGNAGFENINIDIIYGLPGQGIKGWQKTLGEIEKIQPESVTASDLRVHKGTGFFAEDRNRFASELELVEMHGMFLDKMNGLGYKQLFPYQFVKQGKEMKFLENQWNNNEFLGFGASSCSYFNKWDYNNVFPTAKYVETVSENGLACAVGKKLSKEEQKIRHAALGLKNCEGIDKEKFRQRFGTGFDEEFGKIVELLEGLELVENSEKNIKLNRDGILFYDSISRKFFPRQNSKSG